LDCDNNGRKFFDITVCGEEGGGALGGFHPFKTLFKDVPVSFKKNLAMVSKAFFIHASDERFDGITSGRSKRISSNYILCQKNGFMPGSGVGRNAVWSCSGDWRQR
jgi:hypothetical protein